MKCCTALLASFLIGLSFVLPQSNAVAAEKVKIAVVTHGQSSDSYWGVVK